MDMSTVVALIGGVPYVTLVAYLVVRAGAMAWFRTKQQFEAK